MKVRKSNELRYFKRFRLKAIVVVTVVVVVVPKTPKILNFLSPNLPNSRAKTLSPQVTLNEKTLMRKSRVFQRISSSLVVSALQIKNSNSWSFLFCLKNAKIKALKVSS